MPRQTASEGIGFDPRSQPWVLCALKVGINITTTKKDMEDAFEDYEVWKERILREAEEIAANKNLKKLETLVEVPANNASDDAILERVKKQAINHLPEGWKEWNVAMLKKEDILGSPADPQILNRLKFAIPTIGLAQAFFPNLSYISEKVLRDLKIKMLDWEFCIGLITTYVVIQLGNETSGNESSTSTRKQNNRKSGLDKLEESNKEVKDMLSTILQRLNQQENEEEYLDETSDDEKENEPEEEQEPEDAVEDDRPWAPPALHPQEDEEDMEFDFTPKTKEQDLVIPAPRHNILEQGRECQRLGQLSFNKIRYSDVHKKLHASPVFSALKEQLSKYDATLGPILHGMLLQREAFSNALGEIIKKHPQTKADLHTNLVKGEFRQISDDLVQYVCGRRAETIDQRRKILKPKNEYVASLLENIPPSDTHLFEENSFNDFHKQHEQLFRPFYSNRSTSNRFKTEKTHRPMPKSIENRPRTNTKTSSGGETWRKPAKPYKKRETTRGVHKSYRKGGQLRKYIQNWESLGAPEHILKIIKGYRVPFIKKPPLTRLIKKISTSFRTLGMKTEINNMLKEKVLEESQFSTGFLSKMFPRHKQNGKIRPIFNQKGLNKFLSPKKFGLISHLKVPQFLQREDFMAKIDIHQAYLHIAISPPHRRFLSMLFEEKLLQMTCLSFGLSTAPQTFAKLSNWIASQLRDLGIRIIVYLDDFLLANQNRKVLGQQIQLTKKSSQPPWLGLLWNTKKRHNIFTKQKEICNKSGDCANIKTSSLELGNGKKTSWKTQFCHDSDPPRKTPFKISLKSKRRTTRIIAQKAFRDPNPCSERMSLVAKSPKLKSPSLSKGHIHLYHNGRIEQGVGSPGGKPPNPENLETLPNTMAHKQEGTVRRLCNYKVAQKQNERQSSTPSNGQPNGHSLHSKPGRNEVTPSARASFSFFKTNQQNENLLDSSLYRKQLQQCSGQLVTPKSPSRLAFVQSHNQNDLSKMGNTSCGPFCNEQIKSSTHLRVSGCQRSLSPLHRCIQSKMVFSTGVGISSPKSEPRERNLYFNNTKMGTRFLAGRSEGSSASTSITNSNQHLTDMSTSMPLKQAHQLNLEAWKIQEDAKLLESSWRESSLKTYSAPWKQWLVWSSKENVSPNDPSPNQVAQYLSYLHRKKKLAPTTIKLHKSVIATFSNPLKSENITNDPTVKHILKAIEASKPQPGRKVIWDINKLIDWMIKEDIDEQSAFQVSRRTSIILLLASGRRVHDLTLLKIDKNSIEISDNSIILWPEWGSKTDKNPVFWIQKLIHITQKRRTTRENLLNLFITVRGKVSQASRSTIGGWIKTAFKEADLPFSPGSIRSAVASARWNNNTPLDDILKNGQTKLF
ncbi:unnamed protein product [Brassicogethes aeneus]|uniref:Core-binding (CB) domain-containing protein n=1 Tax=Brassicogethes aeneus TaxID=1431903 RepID=A0A9P0AWU2_BRAAE|nr:unnamed protein product [Brassicogethes aeneus]